MYRCSNCGTTMSQPSDVCPNCRALLSGVKCDSCGYLGSKSEFINNSNRCPKCGSVSAAFSKPYVPGLGWSTFAFALSLLSPGLYRVFWPLPIFYSSTDVFFRLAILLGASFIPLLVCIDIVRRTASKISRVLGWAGILVITATSFYGIVVTKSSIPYQLSIKAPSTYSPSIEIPECDSALKQLEAGNDFVCIVSEAGDPLGNGKVWIYDEPKIKAYMGDLGVYASVDDWLLGFKSPQNQPYEARLYENPITEYSDPIKSMLKIKHNNIECSKITGKVEILTLEYLEGQDYYDNVKRFSANFEQKCDDKAATLRGYIRLR